MKLMIIESKGKINKLSAILGPGWQVAASLGHVRDLPEKEMGVEAPEFRPAYELTERGSSIVARLKSLAKSADAVYLATDPDREGEAISWHLQECLRLANPLRVTFNEITASAVKTALLAPRSIDVKRVAAQEARRVLDRLVGYMVSPKLSDQTGVRLSAGRVQSVAVRLVVDRERQIQAFRQTKHFGAALFFAGEKNEWSAEWLAKPDFVTDGEPYFLDEAFAEAIAECPTVVVVDFEEREAKRSPPAPFTTSTMQQAASAALGLNPKAAMDAAQQLYEQGHITYHRTDNPNVSDESLGDIFAVASELGLDMAMTPRRFKAKAGAQEGHPAITPTHWDVEVAGQTGEEQALYQLIRLRAIACQLADATYVVRTITLQAADAIGGKEVQFAARGRTLTYSGWLELTAGDQTQDEDDEKEAANPVPTVSPGQRLQVARGELLTKKTRPPARFTEATLVGKLEAEGIGRPATYAAIMENIVGRGYVRTEKKFLVPTETGELVVDSLADRFEFMDLGFTRDVEEDLDRIARGDAGYRGVIAGVYVKLKSELSDMTANVAPRFPCTSCGKPLRQRPGKSGPFWSCSGYPDCSVTLPDDGGKPGVRTGGEVAEAPCPACGRALTHRFKKGKGGFDFWGCTGFKEGCRQAFPNLNGQPVFEGGAHQS